jgi:hypothetical protein
MKRDTVQQQPRVPLKENGLRAKMRKRPCYSQLEPELCDPSWLHESRPLLEFISTREGFASWSELYTWARVTRVNENKLRNLLAYLEHNHEAVGDALGWRIE